MPDNACGVNNAGPRWIWGAVLALVVFSANLYQMAPAITAGDSAELSAAQTTLGIAHSPGYPLFVLAGKSFAALAPFGSPAYATNLFSVFLSGVSAFLLYALFVFGTGNAFAALAAAFFFMFVPVVREQFLSTEVFALHFVLVCVVLILILRLVLPREAEEPSPLRERLPYFFSFFLGLGLGNQHTLSLILPSAALILVWEAKDRHDRWPEGFVFLGKNAAAFILGLTLYVFLPLRSLRNPLLDWEDPQTWDRFWGVVGRARYGTLQLAQGAGPGLSLPRLAQKTAEFFSMCSAEWTFAVTGLLLMGLVWLFNKPATRRLGTALALFLFLSGPFFLVLSNVNPYGSGAEILRRFLPMPLLVFFTAGVLGVARVKAGIFLLFSLPALVFYLPGAPSLRRDTFVYDEGRNILRSVPPGSLLFSDRADETEFSLAYLLCAEGRRPDVRFVDCNAGVTPSVYGDGYYRIWGKPRLDMRELREKELISLHAGPVLYNTLDPRMINIPRRPLGLLYAAKPDGLNAADPEAFYVLRADPLKPGFRQQPLLEARSRLLGFYYLEKGEREKADVHLRALSALDWDGFWNHRIALGYLEKGFYPEAEKYFLKAVKKGPQVDRDAALCNLGTLYERQNRFGEAESTYRKAVAENLDSYQAHYNLGVLYWKQSRWEAVLKEFKAVLRIRPDHADAKKYLEIAMKKLGR